MSVPNAMNKDSSSELSEYLLPSALSMDVDEQRVLLDEEILPQGATAGERQQSQYRDAGFAIAFIVQLMIVLVMAFCWGFPSLTSSSTLLASSSSSSSSSSLLNQKPYKSDDANNFHFVGWLYVLLLSGLVAFAMSALGLYIMARYAKQLILISTLIYLSISLIVMIQFLVQQVFFGAVIMLVIFAGGARYFWVIQRRIPFASSNLVTASEAIRSNLGILLVAFSMAMVSFLWSVLWGVAFHGARSKTSSCEEYDNSSKQCISTHPNAVVAAFMLLSFFWTHQVILNIVNVTVAGVVATFWFAPEEARSFCSPSIGDSWRRATTTSLGSIALGSLLVAVLQSFQQFVRYIRRHRGEGIFMCLAEFFATMMEKLLEYFNRWAFVFVGVYGDSYLEGGHKAMELFRQRGWSNIINDQLTYNILSLMVVAIGLSVAGVMLGVVAIIPSMVGRLTDSPPIAWIVAIIALSIGMLIASVTMRVVASAVDTVIVCFAESPNDFRRHHPQLHQAMVQAWLATYPTEFEDRGEDVRL